MTFSLANIVHFNLLNLTRITNPGEKGVHVGFLMKETIPTSCIAGFKQNFVLAIEPNKDKQTKTHHIP